LVQRALEFHFFHQPEGFSVGFPGLFFRRFAGLPEIEEDRKIIDSGFDRLIDLYPEFVLLDIFQDLGRPPVIVPKAGA
jgi:hypothetical protein